MTTYRALAMLEGPYAPKVARREPFWRPRAPKCTRIVYTPTWNWESVAKTAPPVQLVTLDVSGAFLAAASSATFAHGQLEPTGAAPADGAPGYYLIDAHPWAGGGIPNPLGTWPAMPERVWVAHPTVALLRQLADDGYWPEVVVHDSYTATVPCRLRKWAEQVRDDRAYALARRAAAEPDSANWERAQESYQAIKDGYAVAIQMMLGTTADGQPAKARIKRPDWYHTIHAQHAANMWRKAWKCVLAGHHPAAMGATDELTFTADDLDALLQADVLPLDETGLKLGSLKTKAIRTIVGEDA